jgi:hypothetical protein
MAILKGLIDMSIPCLFLTYKSYYYIWGSPSTILMIYYVTSNPRNLAYVSLWGFDIRNVT